jgi:hypothetical protein
MRVRKIVFWMLRVYIYFRKIVGIVMVFCYLDYIQL